MRISDWSSDVCSSDLKLRCVLGAQLLAHVVGIGAHEVVEHRGGAAQHLAGLLQRDDGVLERRRFRVLGDRLHLGQFLGHPSVERRREVAVADLVELRIVQRQRAVGGKRIGGGSGGGLVGHGRSEENTSELQSLMRISYAVFCLKKKKLFSYIIHTKRKHTQNYHSHSTQG